MARCAAYTVYYIMPILPWSTKWRKGVVHPRLGVVVQRAIYLLTPFDLSHTSLSQDYAQKAGVGQGTSALGVAL